jgi:hypothetical protein
MKKIAMAMVAGALLASAASADITYDFSQPAANAAAVKTLYGYDKYQGKSSTSTASVAGNAITFGWNLTYAAADGDYGTAAGLLLPVDKSWAIHNISKATAIKFTIKSSAATTMHVIIGDDSATYSKGSAANNGALTSSDVEVTTAATEVVIPVSDLTMPSWLTGKPTCDADITCGTEKFYSTTPGAINIAPHFRNLNMQPVVGWKSKSSISTNASGSFTLSNVVIVGANPWGDVVGANCGGTGVVFGDFASKDNTSAFGTYWYAFSDTASTADKNADTATGGSAILLNGTGKIWSPIVGKGAAAQPIGIINATLEKNNPNSAYTYHAYSGWADIGVQVSPVDGFDIDLTGLSAISFDFYAGADLTTAGVVAPTGQTYAWSDKVYGLTFKVENNKINTAYDYQINIPVTQSNGGSTICVDLDSLKQPSWYLKNNGVAATPFDAGAISKLAWEAKIADQGNTSIHSANVAFGITNVKFYGVDVATITNAMGPTGIKARTLGNRGLNVAYNRGLTVSYNAKGAESAQIDVLRMDGSKVASFTQQAAVASNLSLPVSLTRGTYLVSVRAGKSSMVAPLAVVR